MPDGITYTTKGGYAALKFSTLINTHGGGFTSPVSATGWRIGRVGPRLVVVDPEDAVTYFRGMYVATYDQVHVLGGGQQAGRKLLTSVQQKYAGPGMTWDQAAAMRLKHLHFNSVASNSRWLAPQGGITQQVQSSAGTYTLSGGFGALTEAVKDVARYGVRQNFPGGSWMGRHLVDAFDPKFTQYIDLEWGKLGPNPDIPFYMADDGDYLYFFSSGHGDETGCAPDDSNWVPHGAFVALISNPIITGPFTDPRGGVQRWTVDTKNHTKFAVVEFLKQTYGTIAALNSAWGATYTTFDSTGSWGVGTGLMDEDGLRPRAWFGKDGAPFYQKVAGQNDAFNSTRWAPAVKRDLDRFLGMMMDAYLKPFAERLQVSNPGALFAGHTGVGHRGGMSRRPVWESYGRWLHIMRAGGDGGHPNDAKINAQIRAWTGKDIPWITALYFPNNDDGCLYYIPKGDGTQAARGENIARILKAQAGIRLADGTFPVVGNNFWGMYDQVGERIGWGLWTYNDNGYDGRSYLTSIPDPLATGRMTLTEDRVYGDCHTPIKAAQVELFALIQAQIAGTEPIPIPAPTPVPTPTPTPAPTPGGPMLVTATAAGTTLRVRVEGGPGHWQDQVSIHTTAAYDWPAAASQRTNGPTADLVFTLPPGTYYPRFYFNSQSAGERLSSTPVSVTLPAVVPVPEPVPGPAPVPDPVPAPSPLDARVAALEQIVAKVREALG